MRSIRLVRFMRSKQSMFSKRLRHYFCVMILVILSLSGCNLFEKKATPIDLDIVLSQDIKTVGDYVQSEMKEIAACLNHRDKLVYVVAADQERVHSYLKVGASSYQTWMMNKQGKQVSYQVKVVQGIQEAAQWLKQETDFTSFTYVIRDSTCTIKTVRKNVCINLKNSRTRQFTRSIKTKEGGYARCRYLQDSMCQAVVIEVTTDSWDQRDCRGNYNPSDTFRLRVCAADDT